MALDCKDRVIRKSDFVAKTQFFCITGISINLFFKPVSNNQIFGTFQDKSKMFQDNKSHCFLGIK